MSIRFLSFLSMGILCQSMCRSPIQNGQAYIKHVYSIDLGYSALSTSTCTCYFKAWGLGVQLLYRGQYWTNKVSGHIHVFITWYMHLYIHVNNVPQHVHALYMCKWATCSKPTTRHGNIATLKFDQQAYKIHVQCIWSDIIIILYAYYRPLINLGWCDHVLSMCSSAS